jgi:hypothetical protein
MFVKNIYSNIPTRINVNKFSNPIIPNSVDVNLFSIYKYEPNNTKININKTHTNLI